MSLATASVDIVADTSKFKDDLRRKLDNACAGNTLDKCLNKTKADAGRKIGRQIGRDLQKGLAESCNASKAIERCLNKAGASTGGKLGQKIGKQFASGFESGAGGVNTQAIGRKMSTGLSSASKAATVLKVSLLGVGAAAATIGAAVGGAGVLGLAGGLTAAGVAAAGFAAVAAPAIKKVVDAEKELDDLRAKATDPTATAAARNKALQQEQALLKSLSTEQAGAVKSLDAWDAAYAKAVKTAEKPAFGVMASGLKLATSALKSVTPAIKPVGDAIAGLFDRANAAFTEKGGFWQEFMGWANTRGPQALTEVGNAAGHATTGIASLAKTADETFTKVFGKSMTKALEDGAKGFSEWAQSPEVQQGMEGIFNYAKTNGPKLLALGKQVLDFGKKVGEGLAKISPGLVENATGVMKSINDFATAHPDLTAWGAGLAVAAIGLQKIGAFKLAGATLSGLKFVKDLFSGKKNKASFDCSGLDDCLGGGKGKWKGGKISPDFDCSKLSKCIGDAVGELPGAIEGAVNTQKVQALDTSGLEQSAAKIQSIMAGATSAVAGMATLEQLAQTHSLNIRQLADQAQGFELVARNAAAMAQSSVSLARAASMQTSTSAQVAAVNAQQAAVSASQAATSATQSSASAATAAANASVAAGRASAAATSASAAAGSARAAAGSAGAAAGSARAAGGSAATAQGFARSAATAATAAANSAQAAHNSYTTADSWRQLAEVAADTARTHAQRAQEYRNQATTAAAEAQTASERAQASAEAAQKYARTAGDAATRAANSAADALTKSLWSLIPSPVKVGGGVPVKTGGQLVPQSVPAPRSGMGAIRAASVAPSSSNVDRDIRRAASGMVSGDDLKTIYGLMDTYLRVLKMQVQSGGGFGQAQTQTTVNAPINVQTVVQDPEQVAVKVVSRLTEIASTSAAMGLGVV